MKEIVKTISLLNVKVETETIERNTKKNKTGKTVFIESREDFLLKVLQKRNELIEKYKPILVSVEPDLRNPSYANLIYLKEKKNKTPP